jgi:hypothetical protein
VRLTTPHRKNRIITKCDKGPRTWINIMQIKFNIILPSTPKSSILPLPFAFSDKSSIIFLLLQCVLQAPPITSYQVMTRSSKFDCHDVTRERESSLSIAMGRVLEKRMTSGAKFGEFGDLFYKKGSRPLGEGWYDVTCFVCSISLSSWQQRTLEFGTAFRHCGP